MTSAYSPHASSARPRYTASWMPMGTMMATGAASASSVSSPAGSLVMSVNNDQGDASTLSARAYVYRSAIITQHSIGAFSSIQLRIVSGLSVTAHWNSLGRTALRINNDD